MALFPSLLTLGCSLRPSHETPAEAPGDDDTSTDPPDTDPDPPDTGPPTDTGTGTDDTATANPSICPSGVPFDDAPVVWTSDEIAVSFVDGTGSGAMVFSFEADSGAVAAPLVQADATHVGVLANHWDQDAGYRAELALLQRDGSLEGQGSVDDAYGSSFWLGDGRVTYTPDHSAWDPGEPTDSVVLSSEGLAPLEGWWVMGPVVDGVVPACDRTDLQKCGWVDVATGEIVTAIGPGAFWLGTRLAWGDGPAWVVATPSSEVRLPIGKHTILGWTDDHLLLGEVRTAVAVVAFADGAVTEIGALPEGWHAFTNPDPDNYCPNEDWRLAPDGRVLAVLLKDGVAQVWLHDPTTGTWDPIGQSLADVIYVSVWERDGTILIATTDPADTFCPWYPFEPAKDTLVGKSVQVVRPADGIAWVDPVWAPQVGWANDYPPLDLHSGGTCGIGFTPEGPVVVDVTTGATVALEGDWAGWLE
jgi:hypothetical protein